LTPEAELGGKVIWGGEKRFQQGEGGRREARGQKLSKENLIGRTFPKKENGGWADTRGEGARKGGTGSIRSPGRKMYAGL